MTIQQTTPYTNYAKAGLFYLALRQKTSIPQHYTNHLVRRRQRRFLFLKRVVVGVEERRIATDFPFFYAQRQRGLGTRNMFTVTVSIVLQKNIFY